MTRKTVTEIAALPDYKRLRGDGYTVTDALEAAAAARAFRRLAIETCEAAARKVSA